MSATLPTWVSPRRAAKLTNIPYGTLRQLVRVGTLPGIRHGKGWLIAHDALDAFLRSRGVQRPQIVA